MWGSWKRRRPLRRPGGGIEAVTGRGQAFGQTWWGRSWFEALEALIDPGRLARGRSYARSGQVADLEIAPGRVTAHVHGHRAKPYTVRIKLNPLTAAEWQTVIAALASRAVFAAKLLNGEMPSGAAEVFAAAGVSLFPQHQHDLETTCSCPDFANPCKHSAAVYLLLTERFDADPFLLFTLRGRTQEKVLAALRAERGGAKPARKTSTASLAPAISESIVSEPEPPEVPFIPLSATIADFWRARSPLEELPAGVTAAAIPDALIRALEEPAFWSGPGHLRDHLSAVYEAVTRDALALANGEDPVPAPLPNRKGARPKRTV